MSALGQRDRSLNGRVMSAMLLGVLATMPGCQLPTAAECTAVSPTAAQSSCLEEATFRQLVRTDPVSAYVRAFLGGLPGGLPPAQTAVPDVTSQNDQAEITRLRELVEKYRASEEQLRNEIEDLKRQVPSKQTVSALKRALRESERQRDELRQEVKTLTNDNATKSGEYETAMDTLRQENQHLESVVSDLRKTITWYQLHEPQIDDRPEVPRS
jgi:cell division protein FtsB